MMLTMAKVKTTMYVEEDVLRQFRVAAAREGQPVSELVDEALRESTLSALFARTAARFDLSEEEAMRLANDEVHAYRREQRGE